MLKGKNLKPRILYPARLSLRIGEIKNFSEKQKLKEYSNTKTERNSESSSLSRKEARIYRKGKITIQKVNI